jgi:hypothetical protein
MTTKREYAGGGTYTVERGCRGSCFCRVPYPSMRQIFLYCLARASSMYEVDVHAYSVQPHQWQGVVTNRGGALPSFLTWVHQYLSKSVRAVLGDIAIWDGARAAIDQLHERSAVLDAIARVIEAPALAGPDDHGNASSLRSTLDMFGEGPIVCPRPGVYFRADGGAPSAALLTIVAPGGSPASGARSASTLERLIGKELFSLYVTTEETPIPSACSKDPPPQHPRNELTGAE